MSEPVRVQRERGKGKKLTSPNELPVKYVGRPTPFGNPFKVGKDLTPEQAVYQYRKWVRSKHHQQVALREKIRTELKGVNLACWCSLSDPCHADVLLEIANEQE